MAQVAVGQVSRRGHLDTQGGKGHGPLHLLAHPELYAVTEQRMQDILKRRQSSPGSLVSVDAEARRIETTLVGRLPGAGAYVSRGVLRG